MKKIFVILCVLVAILTVSMLPGSRPREIKLTVPPGWPQPYDIFKDNTPTDAGFLLGKKLFYDGRLSKDGKFPCSSCHEPQAAFATFDHDLSHGFNNQFTTRNAPALQNLAWLSSYQWDGSFDVLAEQAMSPITSPNEMAENIDSVVLKLKGDKDYPRMFFKAFGSKEINKERILKALAQFTGMLVSASSKYDLVKNGKSQFNPSEQHGYEVFKKNCESCHKEPLFTDNTYRNNGLPLDPYLKDYGRMKVTGDPKDSLKFRVPSLRNAGVTQPYMHDGRFYSLQSVVNHYTSGIVHSSTLDPKLNTPINLSPKEKYDLVLFLYTLTDSSFLKNPLYRN